LTLSLNAQTALLSSSYVRDQGSDCRLIPSIHYLNLMTHGAGCFPQSMWLQTKAQGIKTGSPEHRHRHCAHSHSYLETGNPPEPDALHSNSGHGQGKTFILHTLHTSQTFTHLFLNGDSKKEFV
jgi:hypothetical protein